MDDSKLIALSKKNEELQKDNNELHARIIQCDEKAKELEIQFSHSKLKLESEIQDLHFVVTRKDGDIKKLEEKIEGSLKKQKFSNEDLEGTGHIEMSYPLKDSTNNRINSFEFRIQELEIARKQCADELVKADERAIILNSEIKKLKENKSELEETLRLQNEKIQNRDKEISRLSLLCQGPQDIDKLNIEYNAENARSMIENLNKKIDFLNNENRRLEQENEEKDRVINVSEKYKLDRIKMSQKYTSLETQNKELKERLREHENTINDLNEKIEDHNSTLVKRKLVPLCDLTREREKRDELQEQLKKLEVEIRQYKRAEEEHRHYLSTIDLDKQTMNKRFEEIAQENRNLYDEIDTAKQEIRSMTKERDQFRSDSDYYKERAKQMETNYERYKKMADDISLERNVTEDERTKHQKKIISLEDQLSSCKRENSELTFELDRLKRQKDQINTELDSIKQKTNMFKNEYETNNTTLNRIQIINDSTQKRLEVVEKEKTLLEEQIRDKSSQINSKEHEIVNLKREIESLQDSQDIMHQEHKLLSDDLTEKLKELEAEQRKRRDLEKELFDYKHLKDKFGLIEDQVENIVNQKKDAENDNIKHKNRIIELENLLSVKQEVINDSDARYQKLCTQMSEIERKGVKEFDNYALSKQFKDQLEEKQQLISELRLKETSLLESNERIQSDLKKTKYDLEVEKDRVNTYKDSKENVEHELRQARSAMAALEDQLSTGKNESIITEQQKNQAQIEIQDLFNQVRNLKKDKTSLENDNCSLKKQLENFQIEISKLQHEVTKYESLIKTLERSKEDLIDRLQNTNKEKNHEERDRTLLITEIGKLKQLMVEKEQAIQEMRSNIIEYDKRCDNLQSQLDFKTEELYETQNALHIQNAEYTASKQRITAISSKEEGYERRLQEREKEIDELKRQLSMLNKELYDMKEMDNIKSHDSSQLANDVETLTRENQIVKEQLIKLSEEKEYFRIEFENSAGRIKQLQQNIRSIQIEKDDLSSNFKETCSENQRLQDGLSNINIDNKDLINKIQTLEKDLNQANMAMHQYEEKQEQMLYDIQMYDQNVTNLTHQLEAMHQQLQELQGDRDSLIQDQETQRNISFNLESSKEELQRHIVSLENERNSYFAQMDNMKHELDMHIQRADYERQKYHQLEEVLTKERMKMQQFEQDYDGSMKQSQIHSSHTKISNYSQRYNNDYEDDDGTYSIASSNKSYDHRNKAHLQQVISQLESEIDKEEKEKNKI